MNTTLLYGLAMAVISALLNYGLYFAGFHETPEKLGTAQTIGMVAGLLISIACIALGCRARRAETPANEPFGYGRSFLTGFLISLWGVLFGTISQVLYVAVVNPGFRDVVVQLELAKAEARGVTAQQLEQAEGMIRMMTGPVAQGIFGFIFGLIFCTIIALIVAAFVRRPEPSPAVAAAA